MIHLFILKTYVRINALFLQMADKSHFLLKVNVKKIKQKLLVIFQNFFVWCLSTRP